MCFSLVDVLFTRVQRVLQYMPIDRVWTYPTGNYKAEYDLASDLTATAVNGVVAWPDGLFIVPPPDSTGTAARAVYRLKFTTTSGFSALSSPFVLQPLVPLPVTSQSSLGSPFSLSYIQGWSSSQYISLARGVPGTAGVYSSSGVNVANARAALTSEGAAYTTLRVQLRDVSGTGMDSARDRSIVTLGLLRDALSDVKAQISGVLSMQPSAGFYSFL